VGAAQPGQLRAPGRRRRRGAVRILKLTPTAVIGVDPPVFVRSLSRLMGRWATKSNAEWGGSDEEGTPPPLAVAASDYRREIEVIAGDTTERTAPKRFTDGDFEGAHPILRARRTPRAAFSRLGPDPPDYIGSGATPRDADEIGYKSPNRSRTMTPPSKSFCITSSTSSRFGPLCITVLTVFLSQGQGPTAR
jgi:hypothetical protein